jgi:hypothetical protein
VDPATYEFWTMSHGFDAPPPETVITAGSNKVAQVDNDEKTARVDSSLIVR